jgi:hypothetical protein
VVRELADDGRVVVRRHAPVGQAARAGLGEAPPLRVAEPAVGLVGGAKEGLQLGHGGKGGRLAAYCLMRSMAAGASCGALSLSTRLWMRFQLGLEVARCRHRAERAAHRGADPVAAGDVQLHQQLARQPGVEGQAVFVLGAPAHWLRPRPMVSGQTTRQPRADRCAASSSMSRPVRAGRARR